MEKKIALLLCALLIPLAGMAQIPDTIARMVHSLPGYRIHDTSEIVVPIEHSAVARRVFGLGDTLVSNGHYSPRAQLLVDSIQKSGFLTQQFSNGNNRNLSQNTLTDLSLSTNIQGLGVSAHVVDSDMPVDSYGATSQISELSSILIKVSRDSSYLAVGDTVVMRSGSFLSDFSKKIKGMEFLTVNSIGKADTLHVRTDLAAAKGRFCRQNIVGINNSQGPYYLRASDSDLSVIVLIGTEKVFLDGVLLARGPDSDYEIDYNAGSITFNVRHVISSRSRIVVDFEYSESVFNHYFVYADAGVRKRNVSFDVGYMSDFDGIGQLDTSVACNTPPRRNDYLILSAGVHNSGGTSVNLEGVGANIQSNRLQDTSLADKSFGSQIYIKQQLLNSDTARSLELGFTGKYLSEGFVPLTTDKDVGFAEKWGLRHYQPGGGEALCGFYSKYAGSDMNVRYGITTSDISGVMRGVGQELQAGIVRNRFETSASGDFYSNRFQDYGRRYINGCVSATYNWDSARICLQTSQKRVDEADTVCEDFHDWGVSLMRVLSNGDCRITYNERGDSRFFTSEVNLHGGSWLSFQALEIFKNDSRNSLNSVTGQMRGQCSLLDNQFCLSFSQQQECGNQEQMSYRYIKTSAGNGHFCWVDRNADGVEDIDEFEVSYYKTDADYVRYFEHTGKYINTLDNSYMLSVRFAGRMGEGWLRSFAGRLAISAQWDYRGKSALNSGNAFVSGDSIISQVSTQAYRTRFMVLDFLYLGNSYSENVNRRLTYYGPENSSQLSKSYFAEFPFGFGLTARYQYSSKLTGYFSDYFLDKNYDISTRENLVELRQNFAHGLTLISAYSNGHRRNAVDLSRAVVDTWNLSLMYESDSRGSIAVVNRLVVNRYPFSAYSYQMLEGLAVGKNIVSSITASYMIGRYLELILEYEMRASQNSRAIHTGNMQLKLKF